MEVTNKQMDREKKKRLIHYMYEDLEWLYTHNKNYTKEQYFRIGQLVEILNEIYSDEGIKAMHFFE